MFRKTRDELASLRGHIALVATDFQARLTRRQEIDDLTNQKVDSIYSRQELCWERIKNAERQQVRARVRANSRDDHKVIPKHHTDTYSRKYYITLECVCGFVYMTEPHRIEAQAREEATAATQLHEEGVL